MSDIYGNTPGTNDRFANGPDDSAIDDDEREFVQMCEELEIEPSAVPDAVREQWECLYAYPVHQEKLLADWKEEMEEEL